MLFEQIIVRAQDDRVDYGANIRQHSECIFEGDEGWFATSSMFTSGGDRMLNGESDWTRQHVIANDDDDQHLNVLHATPVRLPQSRISRVSDNFRLSKLVNNDTIEKSNEHHWNVVSDYNGHPEAVELRKERQVRQFSHHRLANGLSSWKVQKPFEVGDVEKGGSKSN